MAKYKSKIRLYLIKWLDYLKTSNCIDGPFIYSPNYKWFKLYKRFFPVRTSEENVNSIAQLSYYLSSLALDQIVDGLSRKVIRNPKFQIFYKLVKHDKNSLDEDRTVERCMTRNSVKASYHRNLQVSDVFMSLFHIFYNF